MAVEGHRLQLVQEVMRFRTLKNIVQAVKRSRPPPAPPALTHPARTGKARRAHTTSRFVVPWQTFCKAALDQSVVQSKTHARLGKIVLPGTW